MNELLKKYLDDNFDLSHFNVKELTSYIVELTDRNNDKISIMNLMEDIIVYINNVEYKTYFYDKRIKVWIERNKRYEK